MKRTVVVAIFAAAALLSLDGTGLTTPRRFTPHRVADVMTCNVYIGADLTPIFTAGDINALLAAVAEAWSDVQTSNIPARAAMIADEIASASPALVGLQEVARWSTGPSQDDLTVRYDFLDLILAQLAADGAHYALVAVHENPAPPVPAFDQNGFYLVQLTDREVMLIRTDIRAADLKISNVQQGTFSNLLNVSLLGQTIPVSRGWISADAKIRGKNFRLITSHLEPASPLTTDALAAQVAQAEELLQGPANTALPVVLAGDFNSDANQGGGIDTTPTYPEFIAAGFQDTWKQANPGDAGNTCCQDEDLQNQISKLYERIDLVMIRGGIGPATAVLFDTEATAVPFWASDHAALNATLRIPIHASR